MDNEVFYEYCRLYDALDEAQKAICSEYCSFGASHNPNCMQAHDALRRAYKFIVDHGGWTDVTMPEMTEAEVREALVKELTAHMEVAR